MFAFGLTIFWGACLLFLVQPLIARFILPWFGGGPAVWTTCMLFFQFLLLGGYAYAHFSINRLRPRQQVILHLSLLALALLLLPITPSDQWKPVDSQNPAGHILLLLLACMGLPYLVLSATGPLFQAWFSATHPGVSPYRLYALSNIGSLLALLGYPFLMEPNLGRHAQAVWWSGGLGVFAVLATWCGVTVWQRASSTTSVKEVTDEDEGAISGFQRFLWFGLPACGVVLLLAVTNKICQDIAVIPFLWVLPLGLYLLTFIISFDSPRWYRRRFWLTALLVALAVTAWLMLGDHTITVSEWFGPLAFIVEKAESVGTFAKLGLYLATLFISCMVCHGEVYRLRPSARRLTGYFLSISAGGAVGGLFVAGVAPLIFLNYFELHMGLLMLATLVVAVLYRDPRSPLQKGTRRWAWVLLLIGLPIFATTLVVDTYCSLKGAKELSRNFYGVLKVNENYAGEPDQHQFSLQHGGTLHGLQFTSPEKRKIPATYYTDGSGVGRLMRTLHPEGGRKIAVVGLGTGSMAAWGRKGDQMRFYEINDDVVRLARSTFTFLADSAAKIEVVMGDARLSLERETDQNYDAIVLDAFSSDAIPVHLITREAFETYRRQLKPGGVIAVHISNRCLNLEPVVLQLAKHFQLTPAVIHDSDVDWGFEDDSYNAAYSSDWILLSKDKALLDQPFIASGISEPEEIPKSMKLWTDEQSDLLSILMVDDHTFLSWLKGL